MYGYKIDTKVMNNTEKMSVCITGSGGGLGYELIHAFLVGTDLHVAAVTRDGKALRQKLKSVEGYDRISIIEADITTDKGRKAIYHALNDLPELGYFIHNAGVLVFKPFKEITESELTAVYNVNVFAPFLLTQKLLPLMRRTHIINISSIGGVEGSMKFAGLSVYSSSKAALNCLTEMWSEEFKDTDNVFNCLALGSVETEMFKTAFPGVSAASGVGNLARYIVSFALQAPSVMRGKIIPLSISNP